MRSLSETEILQRCKKGDKHAFGILVNLYKKRAYFSALGFVHDRDRALDLSQEAFVRVWQSIKKIDPTRKFFTWYYAILKNICLNEARKKNKQPRPYSEFVDFELEEIKDSDADISATLENNELKEMLWNAINKLSENEKEILMLREFQDLSYSEISETLNCPQGTVMSRLYSARKALKSNIGKHL